MICAYCMGDTDGPDLSVQLCRCDIERLQGDLELARARMRIEPARFAPFWANKINMLEDALRQHSYFRKSL